MIYTELRLQCLKLSNSESRVAEAEEFFAFVTGQSEQTKLCGLLDDIQKAFRTVAYERFDKSLALHVLGEEIAKAFKGAGLSEDLAYIETLPALT